MTDNGKRWLWVFAGLLLLGGGATVYSQYKQRGIRNNNPGNIRWSAANNWRGQVGKDSGGFVIFDDPLNGLRASARLIKNKLAKGQTTIAALIATWAPPNENNTAAYIATVARALGVDARAPLTAAHVPALLAAIVQHENGVNPYPADLIRQAVAAA